MHLNPSIYQCLVGSKQVMHSNKRKGLCLIAAKAKDALKQIVRCSDEAESRISPELIALEILMRPG